MGDRGEAGCRREAAVGSRTGAAGASADKSWAPEAAADTGGSRTAAAALQSMEGASSEMEASREAIDHRAEADSNSFLILSYYIL